MTTTASAAPRHAVARSAPPPVGTTLLLPQQRVARWPLVLWAENLIDRLHACPGGVREPRAYALDVAGVANNAALLAAHHGAANASRTLCELQILWQNRFSRRSHDAPLAAHALQPWINLGRLECIIGEWESAVWRYSRLHDYARGIPVAQGHVRIRCTGWDSITPTPEAFNEWIEAVFAGETVRAYLHGRQFEQAVAFVDSRGPEVPRNTRMLLAEAAIIAHAQLGRLGAAERLAWRMEAVTRGWEKLVFRLRAAEAMAGNGRPDEAAEMISTLAELVGGLSNELKTTLQSMYVIHRIAAACRSAGLRELAVARARDVYQAAVSTREEAFQIESLQLLAEESPRTERERWRAELERLETATLYKRYRRADAPSDHPSVERMYAELGNFLRN